MPSRRNFLIGSSAMVVAGFAFASSPALAMKNVIFADKKTNIAINGYDPVAYFLQDKPVEGIAEFSFEWRGAIWHFSSNENKEMFVAEPEKYAPQYGGYCAYAVSRGYTAPTVPEAFSIVNDRLYLNFSLNVRKTWRKKMAENIAKADNNWPDVLK